MKKWLKIVLAVSLVANLIFAYLQLRPKPAYVSSRQKFKNEVADTDIRSAREDFLKDLRTSYPQLADKKYLFISVWSADCWTCFKGMPLLDTVIEPVLSEFGYVFLSAEKNEYAKKVLADNKVKPQSNFVFLNNQKALIYSVLKEKNIPLVRFYGSGPMNLIMNQKADVVFLDTMQVLCPIPERTNANRIRFRKMDSLDHIENQKHVKLLDSIFNAIKQKN
jgi:hypothetical protein